MIKNKLTEAEILALDPTVGLVTAGRALGIGRELAYQLARAGEFPCPVLPLGRRYVVTKIALLKVLGYDVPEAGAA